MCRRERNGWLAWTALAFLQVILIVGMLAAFNRQHAEYQRAIEATEAQNEQLELGNAALMKVLEALKPEEPTNGPSEP